MKFREVHFIKFRQIYSWIYQNMFKENWPILTILALFSFLSYAFGNYLQSTHVAKLLWHPNHVQRIDIRNHASVLEIERIPIKLRKKNLLNFWCNISAKLGSHTQNIPFFHIHSLASSKGKFKTFSADRKRVQSRR